MAGTVAIQLDAITKPGQVVLPAMAKSYRIELTDLDLGQLLDGMDMRTGGLPAGEFFVIEECSQPEEADAIAAHYRSIIATIRRQMEVQS
jgi:hypothetical protein